LSKNITQLLERVNNGDGVAEKQLADLIYPELKQIAVRQMSRERQGHTLQATALINEVYLELFRNTQPSWDSRNDFFAYASTVMRHILVNHARRKKAQKRGGDLVQVTLVDVPGEGQKEDDLVALDDALTKLARIDQRKRKIVEMRFFGGLTLDEIAQITGLSLSSVNKELKAARGWLFHKMKD